LNMDGGASKNTKPSYASLEFDLADSIDQTVSQKLASIMRSVRALEEEFKTCYDPNFDPPFPTLNIGMVRTRQEYILFLATCQVPPSVEQVRYEKWMTDLKKNCEDVGAVFRITEYIQPYRTALNSPIVKAVIEGLGELNLDYSPAASAKSTEANIFGRFGMECVLLGAGNFTEAAQIPNESVSIEDLEKSIRLYEKVLARICL
ncbi:MAG: M20/M25/M40 family metallo-hydrolase, partial [Fimbriimonadaceae bacterium]